MDDAKKNVVQKRLSQKMAEEMISALRSASSSDFDVFKSEMESLESIKGMRADFLTQLEDKQVALTKQKMISTGSKAAIKFNLETRRRLEREIAEIESSVSELDKEFLPAVEANIKDISEKISLTLMSAIVEGKKPYQIRFNEICSELKCLMFSLPEALDLVRNDPMLKNIQLVSIFHLREFDTKEMPSQ